MSKRNKLSKYNPTGKVIGIDTGFVQAATLLDIAATAAIEAKDFDLLARVAGQWIELSRTMGRVLGGPSDEEFEGPEHAGSEHPTGPIGFGVTAAQLKEHHGRTNK